MNLCKYCGFVGEVNFSSEQVQFFDIFLSEAYLNGDKFFILRSSFPFIIQQRRKTSQIPFPIQSCSVCMKGRKKMNSKKKLYGMAALLSLLLLVGCSADEDTATNDSSAVGSSEMIESSSEQDESMMEDSAEGDMEESESLETPYIYGAVGALADNNLTMEEMFTYAIQDEHLAHEEYAYVLETFGDQAPFNNIISSEAQHITEMTVLFEKYNLAVPADESADHIQRVADVREALDNCATGEVDNIAMYNKFLEQDIPDDVRATFTALRNASEGHLQAFNKSLEKY